MDQTREQRLAMLDWQSTELPLTVQADILSLNRSSLYYKPVPPRRKFASNTGLMKSTRSIRFWAPGGSQRF